MVTQLDAIKKDQVKAQVERDAALQLQAHATETITAAEWIAAAVQHANDDVSILGAHPLALFMEKACGPVGFDGDPASWWARPASRLTSTPPLAM